MDNAIDALKIAFAVFVFVMALSISMRVFSQAKAVSDEVFYMTDKTNFYEYEEGNERPEGRIVSVETIIPTLYRYYKENFNVIICDAENNVLWEFNLEKEIKKYQTKNTDAPWVGNANIDTKKRVDIEVFGLTGNKINGFDWESQTEGGILQYVKNIESGTKKECKFLETFKEIRYSGKEITINEQGELVEVGEGENQVANPEYGTLELVKGNTKIEITYQLLSEDDEE